MQKMILKGVLCGGKHWYVLLKVLTFVSALKSCRENSFEIRSCCQKTCFIIDLCLVSRSMLYSFILDLLLLWEMFVVWLENVTSWLF